MTPEDIARVTATAARMQEDTALVSRFYEVLFERRPDFRPMFPDDLDPQVHRFVAEIGALAAALPDLRGFEGRAQALGERHARYGVVGSHYPVVRDALIDALEERIGPEFTAEYRTAWARAFNLLAEIMQESRPPVRVE